jgi:hypothetical protein
MNIATVVNWGGLCNRLFQIGALLGYCEKYNYKPIVYTCLLADNKHQSLDATLTHIKECFPKLEISNEQVKKEDFEIITIPNAGNNSCKYFDLEKPKTNKVILEGYFQSELYFPKDKLFLVSFKNNYTIKTPIIEFCNIYFIHLRMGDYLNHYLHDLGKKNYIQYILKSIKIITSRHSNVTFLICTNGNKDDVLKYYQDIFNNIKYMFESDINSNLDSLTTLKHMGLCQGGICMNSSFSWFGAYLSHLNNADLIIMPNKWFNEWGIDKYEDIYPKWDELQCIQI